MYAFKALLRPKVTWDILKMHGRLTGALKHLIVALFSLNKYYKNSNNIQKLQ